MSERYTRGYPRAFVLLQRMVVRACWAGIVFSILTSASDARAQSGPGGGVGGPPPDTTTSTTNRVVLDVEGRWALEFVETRNTTYVPDFSGWVPRTSTTVTLAPLGENRILVSDVPLGPLSGSVPVLAAGASIGPAPTGQHWDAMAQMLVLRVEPNQLGGPLAPVWFGAPGTNYLGIRLGTEAQPIYGWLGFTRDRGVLSPFQWGFAREVGLPVAAGDPGTLPPVLAEIRAGNGSGTPRLSWTPAIAGVAVEEWIPGGTTWRVLENPSDPLSLQGGIFLPVSAPPAQAHLFRVRSGPQ